MDIGGPRSKLRIECHLWMALVNCARLVFNKSLCYYKQANYNLVKSAFYFSHLIVKQSVLNNFLTSVEFEDGLWIGNHLKARNGLQRVHTIPGVQPGAVRTPGFLRGQTEFQSAWVRVAAW